MPTRIEDRRLEQIAVSQTRERAADVQLALLLTYITLGWMTIEEAASLLLGWASKSLLLEAFGIDSIIELFSASVLLWRLRIEARGCANEARVESVEHRASRLIGYTLYFLVGYVVFNSAYGIFIAHRVTNTHESAWGRVGESCISDYRHESIALARALNGSKGGHLRLSAIGGFY
jgi:hypothetical protein